METNSLAKNNFSFLDFERVFARFFMPLLIYLFYFSNLQKIFFSFSRLELLR